MANADLSTRRGLLLLWPVCVIDGLDAYFGFGSTIEFREEELLLLRSGYV